jgi:hypothetical protein
MSPVSSFQSGIIIRSIATQCELSANCCGRENAYSSLFLTGIAPRQHDYFLCYRYDRRNSPVLHLDNTITSCAIVMIVEIREDFVPVVLLRRHSHART